MESTPNPESSPTPNQTLTVISRSSTVAKNYNKIVITPSANNNANSSIDYNRLKTIANQLIKSPGTASYVSVVQSNQGKQVPARAFFIPNNLIGGPILTPTHFAPPSSNKQSAPKIILLPNTKIFASRTKPSAVDVSNLDLAESQMNPSDETMSITESHSDLTHLNDNTIATGPETSSTSYCELMDASERSQIINADDSESVVTVESKNGDKRVSCKAYTIAERVDIVEMYFETQGAYPDHRRGQLFQMISDRFKTKHGRPVSRAVVTYHVEKFRSTGSVWNDYSKSGRRPKEHPEIEARVLEEIRKDDTISIRQLMKMTNSSYHVIRGVLRSKGYKSFKTKYPNTYVLKIPDYHGRSKNKDPRIVNEDKPDDPVDRSLETVDG